MLGFSMLSLSLLWWHGSPCQHEECIRFKQSGMLGQLKDHSCPGGLWEPIVSFVWIRSKVHCVSHCVLGGLLLDGSLVHPNAIKYMVVPTHLESDGANF